MKKILTFLVMLVACVSILSAQEIPAKFNYQAVVRDRNNSDNLVMEQTVNVAIEIVPAIETADNDFASYFETREVTTNRNGMVSFVIGSVEGDGNLNEIDWSNALIRATFTDAEGETLSVVENVVMAVPYALQSGIDPMPITTQKILDYIAEANGNDVNAIYQAIITNTNNISKDIRDSIVNYIKTQDSVVRELAFYYLAKVTPEDLTQAKATLTTETKQAIKDNIKDYLKSADGKELVYDVIADYLTNTTKTEVQELWAAARANEQFHEIFNAVRDSVIDYIKHHEDLVVNIVKYYIDSVITVNDVTQFHNYLKTAQNGTIYQYMLDKFNNYLNHYLSDVYKAANNVGCEEVTVCGLQEQIDQLKESITLCPAIQSATITPADQAGDYQFSVVVVNTDNTFSPATHLKVNGPDVALPTGNSPWQPGTNGYYINYPAGSGTYTFSLDIEGDNCPVVSTKQVVIE